MEKPTFRQWASPLVSPLGKYATYNELPDDVKKFYKEAYNAYVEDPTKFKDIFDYRDFSEHPFKYKVKRFFKKGGNE